MADRVARGAYGFAKVPDTPGARGCHRDRAQLCDFGSEMPNNLPHSSLHPLAPRDGTRLHGARWGNRRPRLMSSLTTTGNRLRTRHVLTRLRGSFTLRERFAESSQKFTASGPAARVANRAASHSHSMTDRRDPAAAFHHPTDLGPMPAFSSPSRMLPVSRCSPPVRGTSHASAGALAWRPRAGLSALGWDPSILSLAEAMATNRWRFFGSSDGSSSLFDGAGVAGSPVRHLGSPDHGHGTEKSRRGTGILTPRSCLPSL